MKACIAVADYYVPGQTFVNRHIEKMFGGNTCVVAGRLNDKRPVDERFFERRARPVLGDVLKAPVMLPFNLWRYGTERVPFGRARVQLMAWLEEQKPDVILSEFGTQGVVLAPIAQAAGIPMFTYFRGSDASSRLREASVRRAYRQMFPRLTGVVAVSQFLLDNLADKAGVRHDNAHVIPSGVDVRWFAPEAKRPLSALAVGRMVEKKQPLMTLDAFAEARKVAPEATLTMVGDGPLLAPLRARVADLGLADAVSLPGALPHEQVREIAVTSEIFLQHSLTADDGNTEGLPTAIQEAMAAACVTVSTRHAGIPEAIDEEVTGFLVDERDAGGYTARVVEAFAMPSTQRAAMGARARDVACERFDNGKLLTKLEEVLTKAARG
ncbi:glycosyltransferase [Pseudaestuariivita atlantica]|uniref:Glycosyl transferase family 1 n=1 Tax=Pseudaestuariivita atlantica TaxID=1317121 RepID=A0A0L1JW15_9RHOB|nr:glycosyltransferase [Pseudaestuariivita atlantica]KNG95598.1 glycosyl transferase family 1 [Pseudaestuariivita atlantica]